MYWRQSKFWKQWLGRKGVVEVATRITVCAPNQEAFKPYSYVLVNFHGTKHECMGVGHEGLAAGDPVECVLRRITSGDERGLIGYGIKVRKVSGG